MYLHESFKIRELTQQAAEYEVRDLDKEWETVTYRSGLEDWDYIRRM